MPQVYAYDGWSYARLQQQRNRAHFLLDEPYRFVTVLLVTRTRTRARHTTTTAATATAHDDGDDAVERRLYCIDSPCYHAAGPLGEGDVVDVEDMPCVRCPWHHFLVSLDDGREVRLVTRPQDDDKDDNDDDDDDSCGEVLQQQRRRRAALPTYPLQPLEPHAACVTAVRRGKRVQRTHAVALDEATGILTITVQDERAMTAQPLPSDAPARSVRDGALCMQIAHLKSERQQQQQTSM